MSWQRSLQAAVRALKKEEASLEKELGNVRAKIRELEELARAGTTRTASRSGPRRLSPQGRAAISRAAKKRWVEYRRQKQKKTQKSR